MVENDPFLTLKCQIVKNAATEAPYDDAKRVSAMIWDSWVVARSKCGIKRGATARVEGENAKKFNENLELELQFKKFSLEDHPSSPSVSVPANVMPVPLPNTPGKDASVEVEGVGVMVDESVAPRLGTSSNSSVENSALGNALMVEMGTAAGPLCGNLPSQQFATACSDVFPPEVKSLSSNPVIGQCAAETSNGKQDQPNVFNG